MDDSIYFAVFSQKKYCFNQVKLQEITLNFVAMTIDLERIESLP